MDVLYFAFANDPDRPLDELKREDAGINQLLEPLAARGQFKIVRDSFATLDTVADKLSLYKRDLVLFHFSGHAGPDQLLLDGQAARSRGIAALLGACPRLRLAVLNGCATYGQVALLHEQKVPLVIATHRPVEDPRAAAFALQLYRALAQQDTAGAAFDAARGKTQALDDSLDIPRGLALRGSAAETPCWGLSWAPGREDAADWRLPSGAPAVPDDFVPNTLLLDALLKALAPYRPDIARIVQDEVLGAERNILDKREAVLKALPHPISEPVRFLLTPRGAEKDMKFYDQPGKDRLGQMSVVFDTVAELMAFILLAQLWDALNEHPERLPLPDDARDAVLRLLQADAPARRQYDFFALTQTLRHTFDTWKLPYFVEELGALRDEFREGTPFFEACRYFAGIKTRFHTLGEQEAAGLCIEAEAQLARVLLPLGFVARYSIASVKNIDVLKYKHLHRPNYRHIIVKLEQRFVGLVEEPRILTEAMDTCSVLLIREDPGGAFDYLNLTPFVIDENAFDDKVKIVAKLHHFERYLREADAYAYRHIYMPGDLPLVVSDQKHYRVLKAQFDAFARLLFNQPMQGAL